MKATVYDDDGVKTTVYQGSHQPGKSGRVRESQGIWVVRESQGKVREFWMESGKKKKRRKNAK